MDNKNNRFCEPFNMNAQQFYDYKLSKKTRIIWYILGMIFMSLFIDRMTGYLFLTLLLIGSYWYDAKREKQWKKDGAITESDLK